MMPECTGTDGNARERTEFIGKQTEVHTMNKIPKTLRQFTEAIAGNPAWKTSRVPAERDDSSATRVIFWLTSDPNRRAIVAREFGRLIVTIDPGRMNYWFNLDRLNEKAPAWSWQKQLAEKSWCQREHLDLIDALCLLFPHKGHAS